MYLYVRPMRTNGRPIEQAKLRSATATYGDLRIEQMTPPELGRPARTARLVSSNPMEHSALPPLFDATVHSMSTNGFVLSGIEMIDGVAYAQSWWCRPDE